MKKFQKSIPFALSLLAAGACQVAQATAPSGGAYVTDKHNTWVQDKVGDRIGTVNMIMCIISSLRGDAMVNQGPYVALVDQGKCEGRGDSSKSGSNNAGASNATNYMSAVVSSSQASETDPLIIKGWLHDEQGGGGGAPQKMTIYVYITATAGKSATNPNGLFSMYFCGLPSGGGGGGCMFSGSLKSDSSGLSFYQSETGGGGGGGASITALKLQTDPAAQTGAGLISTTDTSGTSNFSFAYDANIFHRNDGTVDACLTRDINRADYSTWRYGTYNTDGSRLESAHPGFPVKYVTSTDTYYGFWGFWGLWLPDSAMATLGTSGTLTRNMGGADETLTVNKKGGKLWRLAKNNATLDDFKNVSMMYWSQAAIGSGPTNTNYEVQWDGSALNAIGYQDCSPSGCSPHALSSAVALDASALATAHINALPIFFPSGGGNGAINVPGSGAFTGANTVSYRTRDVVDPGSSDITLHCVSMCPKTSTLVTGSGAGATLASPAFQDAGAWGPTATKYDYTFHAGMVGDGGGAADASTIPKSNMGSNQWGLTSGSMVAAADLNSIKCDSNGTPNSSGTFYCPNLIDQAATTYQWETGPNQWNQFFGASVGGTPVTIDAPKTLTLDAAALFDGSGNPDPSNNISGSAAGSFHGNKVQLQFSGFGELQGVPGSCVDPDTNGPAACGPNTRWVPAFNIKDGTALTGAGGPYYVHFLEREMRLGSTSCSGAPAVPGPTDLTLPTAGLVDVNPVSTNGAEPTPGSTKAAVIDGIVQ